MSTERCSRKTVASACEGGTARAVPAAALTALTAALMLGSPARALGVAQREAEPEYAEVLTQFLNHIVAGQTEAALELVDLRGLADHLMEQRMAVLRRERPEMTAEEEARTRAKLRDEELHPDNLRRVIRAQFEEMKPPATGATWQVVHVAPGADPTEYVAQCRLTLGDRQRTITVGLRKVGPRWHIAPHVVERRLMEYASKKSIPPPEPVVAAGNAFWGHWRDGALDEAYALASEGMRQRVPLVQFLEAAQKMIEQMGVLSSWEIQTCREVAPDRLHVVYRLDYTKMPSRGLLEYTRQGETWQLSAVVLPYFGP